MDLLSTIIFGNSIQDWLGALGILVGVFILLVLIKRIIKNRVIRLIKKTENEIDNFIIPVLDQTRWFSFVALGLYLGLYVLELPADLQYWVNAGIQIAFVLQIGFWGSGAINYYVNRNVDEKVREDQGDDATTLDALGLIARIFLWVILTLIVLDNFNVEISSLIASLGIGGIAVALSITIDKPFVIGDFVEVDEFEGDVEDIGLKSTRIRSLSGEELIFSNADLLNSRIRNYRRLEKRRISFSVGVVYGTPVDKLMKIPGIVEDIITPIGNVEFERVHFKTLGDFSLNYSIVYYMLDPAYASYLDVQQKINLELYQRFEQEGIEFAYPTQTVIMEPKR